MPKLLVNSKMLISGPPGSICRSLDEFASHGPAEIKFLVSHEAWDRLNDACLEEGLNQRSLALLLGVTRQQLHFWVSGQRPVDYGTFKELCGYLEVKCSKILFG